MDEYDYVVVGGGAAGCVLAARLAEDGRFSVALLEQGREDVNRWIHVPATFSRVLRSRDAYAVLSEPDPSLDGARFPVPQGRVLGGGSSVNGMVYIRGQREDYDDWVREFGCIGWGFEQVLPVFVRQERNQRLGGPYHGRSGRLVVGDQAYGHRLCRAWVEAAVDAGFAANDDFNGERQEGVGFYQLTAHGGRRQSAARCFLAPVRHLPTLTLLTEHAVERVRFTGGRAAAVEARGPAGERLVRARREIVLTAGSFQSPTLLMRSGIGPAEHLRRHGIDLMHDAPEVGANYQDHVATVVSWRTRDPIGLYGADRGLRALGHGIAYYLARRGLLTSNLLEAGGFIDTAGTGRPDVQFHVSAFVPGTPGQPPEPWHGMHVNACVLRPASRGRVSLASRDPAVAPRFEANALASAEDLTTLRRAVEAARETFARAPLRELLAEEVSPGAGLSQRTDPDGFDRAIRRQARTVYHPAGTCRMGPDVSAVVDLALRVRGVEGLRVADCSVMPRLVSGNTNAPTMMIADRAADLILADA